MAEMNQEVDFHITERSIRWLASALRLRNLKVAKHQRHAGVWKDEYKKQFIDSLKKGHPCPMILIYQDEDGVMWLEDGLQRLTTLNQFMNDVFGELKTEQKFSEWSDLDRQLFEHKKLPVLIYSNASPQTRVVIFDRFQNGSPLKPGERLNSLSDTVLVNTTLRLLLADKDDTGNVVLGEYYPRLCSVLGHLRILDDDKRYTQLLDMVAVMNGMAHGFVVDKTKYEPEKWPKNAGITKKYEDDLRPNLMLPIDEGEVRILIECLLYIFEEARRRYPTDDRNKLTVYRNPGNFIGPIVYSLKMFSRDWQRLRDGWIDVIVKFAQTASKDEMKDFLYNDQSGLLRGLSKARSWNNVRWQFIYENAFNIPHAGPPGGEDDGDESDDTE